MLKSQFSLISRAAKQTQAFKLPSRFYASQGLSKNDIQQRIFDVLKSFDKVKADNVS